MNNIPKSQVSNVSWNENNKMNEIDKSFMSVTTVTKNKTTKTPVYMTTFVVEPVGRKSS